MLIDETLDVGDVGKLRIEAERKRGPFSRRGKAATDGARLTRNKPNPGDVGVFFRGGTGGAVKGKVVGATLKRLGVNDF